MDPPADNYVLLPHLDKTEILVYEEDGTSTKMLRWELIKQELAHLKEVIMSKDPDEKPNLIPRCIEDCILTYNPDMECTFRILEDAYISEVVQDKDIDSTILFIIHATVSIERLFKEPIPFLKGESHQECMSLSRDQVCSILGNAFFCTFPERNGNPNFKDYPRINFNELFDDSRNFAQAWSGQLRPAKVEKTKCFFNYFVRMKDYFHQEPDEYILYERKSLIQYRIPDWEKVSAQLQQLRVHSKGSIGDCVGSLQLDFANEFVGGGTLGNGAAMEEIKFSLCPELVAAQLFTKKLEIFDSLLVHRFEQYSTYTGYSSTFQFTGNYRDYHMLSNHIACVDASQFPKDSTKMQYEKKWIDREMNKLLSALQPSQFFPNDECSNVEGGKWGCGVFNGDPLLKSLIQWMAASACGKSLDLYASGDEKLTKEVVRFEKLLMGRTVGELYKYILEFGEWEMSNQYSLFEFIKMRVNPIDEDEVRTEVNGMTMLTQGNSWWSTFGLWGWLISLFKNEHKQSFKQIHVHKDD